MKRKFKGKICVFGSFEDNELYSRNRQLIDALSAPFPLRKEVRPAARKSGTDNQQRVSSVLRIFYAGYEIVTDFLSLAGKRAHLKDSDLYFIPYPAYFDLIFLRLFTRGGIRSPIIVDAFICLYGTLVNDRKIIKPAGFLARIVAWLEAHTYANCDLILIDTEQQKQELLDRYGLSSKKVLVTPVGINEALWQPVPQLPLGREMNVLFWGTFIPLHGIDTIIEAARLLSDTHPLIRFTLIGDGQTADSIHAKLSQLNLRNVRWNRQLVSSTQLKHHLEMSHCILGIFGDSDKAGNVIPYKAYQAMACNKIFLSRRSPAFSDILDFQTSVPGLILIPPSNPFALAEAILGIYQNYDELSRKVLTRTIYDAKLSNARLREKIATALELLLE